MSRELGVAVMIALAVVILGLMAWGWRRRMARDRGFTVPLGVPEHAEVRLREPVFYVATTRIDEPLERLALRGLSFRAHGEAALTDRGLALSLDGSPTVFIEAAALVSVDRATVAIDKAVEPGGLVRVRWRIADDTPVDSFLRLTGGDAAGFIAALEPLCQSQPSGAAA